MKIKMSHLVTLFPSTHSHRSTVNKKSMPLFEPDDYDDDDDEIEIV